MVKIKGLLIVNEISNMDAQAIFQLTASTAASVCSGASLAFWLLSAEVWKQPAFHKKPVLLSQAIIGGVIIIGSIVSIVLAIRQANPKSGDTFLSIQETGSGSLLLLLVLNEYLSVSTLQSEITHMVAGAFVVGTVLMLSLSIYLPDHRNVLLSSFMVTSLVCLSYVYVQYIKFWARCTKVEDVQTDTLGSPWRYPGRTARIHQRALWVTSILSIGLFLVSLCLAIIACTKTHLWAQLTMLQIAIINLRKALLSIYLLRAPDGSQVQAKYDREQPMPEIQRQLSGVKLAEAEILKCSDKEEMARRTEAIDDMAAYSLFKEGDTCRLPRDKRSPRNCVAVVPAHQDGSMQGTKMTETNSLADPLQDCNSIRDERWEFHAINAHATVT
ncbi:hypothetical protein BJY01DRAFT_16130 [Aspergillus pseudoustus]|uniref:Uncharacterized protein n=1 Tax=Aspergillus pseudoustus TaxID=1810923 RepID=A0ABR4JL88_9EURO